MGLDIQIHEVTDGYWITEGNVFASDGRSLAAQKWVAKDPKDLAALIEKLANKSKPTAEGE